MGFPSPANDYVETRIDLNKILMPHQAHRLMIKTLAGFAIVDRTIQGKVGDEIAFQHGETIDGEGLEGGIMLGKVTATILAVYDSCRPII